MTKSEVEQIKRVIRQPYAWPGGYPLSLIAADGGLICPRCARTNLKEILWATKHCDGSEWQITGYDISWEGGYVCAHCGENVDAYPPEEPLRCPFCEGQAEMNFVGTIGTRIDGEYMTLHEWTCPDGHTIYSNP